MAIDLHNALHANALAPEIPAETDIYGWLIGDWKLKVLRYATADRSAENITGEVHFGRILEGRAIQDVWIMPEKMYGTRIATDAIE